MIMMALDSDTKILGPQKRFQTTRWNLVLNAHDVKALGKLIAIYWKPLYFFVRQHGHDNETAKDIVQEFLVVLLERDGFARADPARGRFRTYLLRALTNFMKDRAKAALREKRGGGKTLFSLDFVRGEEEFSRQVAAGEPPETVLHRAWARSLWQQALSELQGEPSHLEAFRLYLADEDYGAIALQTGLSEGAARTAVHRLKAQLRDIIVGHIRLTLVQEDDLEAELAEFQQLLGRSSL
jgi:RNA polymerase sigma-70 factor (ECF subfamily)